MCIIYIKYKINVMKQVFVFYEYDLASDGPLRRAVVCRTKVEEEEENIKSGEASCVQLFLGTTNEIKVSSSSSLPFRNRS